MNPNRGVMWTAFQHGVSVSRCCRFVCLERTQGYTLVDRSTQEVCRTRLLVTARAVADLRIGASTLHRSTPTGLIRQQVSA